MDSIIACCVVGMISIARCYEFESSAMPDYSGNGSSESTNLSFEYDPEFDYFDYTDMTCEDFILDSYRKEFKVGRMMDFDCKDEDTPPNAKVHWLFNCEDQLPENAEVLDHGLRLRVLNLAYDQNPGLYTCIVEDQHKMKNVTRHLNICVKPVWSPVISLSCSNVTADAGGSARVICDGDGGAGFADNPFYFTSFISKDERSCNAHANGRSKMEATNNTCALTTIDSFNTTCFDKTPTNDELDALRTRLQFIYEIGNVQESDFGRYEVTISSVAHTSKSVTFTISRNQIPGLNRAKFIITGLISFAVFLSMILILARSCFHLELRWIYAKAVRIGQKDEIDYPTYLAYHYSSQMQSDSSLLLKSLVLGVMEFVENKGGIIVDGHRQPWFGDGKPKLISNDLKTCRRVIIILTPELFKDEWGVFQILQAWKRDIEAGGATILLIRIRAAGNGDLDVTKDKDCKTALVDGLKAHSHEVIEWDGRLPFSWRMKLQMDLFFQDPKHPPCFPHPPPKGYHEVC